jgi:hypothetical protein
MKNIFRRNAGNKGHFVVMNSSFDSKPPGLADNNVVNGEDNATFHNDDRSSPDSDDVTSVKSNTNKNDASFVTTSAGQDDKNSSSEGNVLEPRILDWEASKSFLEDDDADDERKVEVMTSENGNSVILGDDDAVLVEKENVSASPARRSGFLFCCSASWPQRCRRRGGSIGDSTRNESTSSAAAPSQKWTQREKILLWITAFNTILIIVLLGSNSSLVKQQKQQKSSSFSPATGNGIDATPPNEWVPRSSNTTNSGSGAGGNNSNNSGPTPAVTDPSSIDIIGDPNSHCGCASCSEEMWNMPAGEFTCGDRITYLATSLSKQYPTEMHACRQIAFEFPCTCSGCDPGRCKLPTPVFVLPSDWVPPTVNRYGQAVTPAPTPLSAVVDASIRPEDQPIYCFPDASGRLTSTLWNGMVIQPKSSESVCGPGNNFFKTNTVVVDEAGDTLTLLYMNGVASEVRVLLPESQRPFTYGTYSFSVRSVEVLNSAGAVLSNALPKELVLGFFTWDPFEVGSC